MPSKKTLLDKLCRKPIVKNFTKQELGKCDCSKHAGGRGSSIRYYHGGSGRILTFDEPHPENELYTYQVKKVIQFLQEIGEISEK